MCPEVVPQLPRRTSGADGDRPEARERGNGKFWRAKLDCTPANISKAFVKAARALHAHSSCLSFEWIRCFGSFGLIVFEVSICHLQTDFKLL